MALVLSLAACGGGHDTGALADTKQGTSAASTEEVGAPSFLPTIETAPSAETVTLQQQGARLNSEELQKIAKTGVLPKAFEGPSLSGDSADQRFGAQQAPKSEATKTAAYRFYNTLNSAHFYTTSEAERDHVRNTLPFMSYEGPAFSASSSTVPGLSPVHRFFNSRTGVHFYTISEEERAHVVDKLPQFKYEGVAYHASTLPGTGYTPLFRFFLSAKGYHFYTNSEAERDRIRATLPQYTYEGIGYYVLGEDWQTPAVPHTGMTNIHCYRAGSNVLVDCESAEALSLNPKQDGHLKNMFPMAYEPVGECQRDKVTGLVWEVKTDTGLRSMNNRYTNHGDKRADDTSSYVEYVNSTALCGFTDWRLPTVDELRGLVNFGVSGNAAIPAIDPNAFPRTIPTYYWTGTVGARRTDLAWKVQFSSGELFLDLPEFNDFNLPVRLVRGAAWTGQRYVVSTEPYPSEGASTDAANNVVIDRKSGLTWRRCLEGQTWTGSTCTGTPISYTHQQALELTRDASLPWRVPNIRELQTLVDPTRFGPAIDVGAFPGSQLVLLWSSTPLVRLPGRAFISFQNFDGETPYFPRLNGGSVRLVTHRAP